MSASAPDRSELDALRFDVRYFLADQRESGVFSPGVDAWLNDWNLSLTSALAERGWIGMTIPTQYGGQGRTAIERLAVTEELVAAGAPVGAHWVADRQVGPSVLRFGTEEQRRRILPGIVGGTRHYCLAMSEPDSGSDLSSVRTRAARVDGGWALSGTKLWISNAHRANSCVVLARTSAADKANRHAGLTQFLIDLPAEGFQINPIISSSGEHHFNEVVLDSMFVSDAAVLGTPGDAWRQLTAELALERSGPERFLSTLAILDSRVAGAGQETTESRDDLGYTIARLIALRAMSVSIAHAVEARTPVDMEAAMLKVLGTSLEGEIVDTADELGFAPGSRTADRRLLSLVELGVRRLPNFTLRGGTNEILRGVIARGLGMR